jgi:hypothetical protein
MPAISPYTIEPISEQFRALLPERKVGQGSTGVFDQENSGTLCTMTASGSRFSFLDRRTRATFRKEGACQISRVKRHPTQDRDLALRGGFGLVLPISREPTSGLEPLTPAPVTSALLAIWARPEGLLAELRPYPLTRARRPHRMEGWLSLLLTDVESHAYPQPFFRHAQRPASESHPGSVRRET